MILRLEPGTPRDFSACGVPSSTAIVLGFIAILSGFTFAATGDSILISVPSIPADFSPWTDNDSSSSACLFASAFASRISRRIASAFSSLYKIKIAHQKFTLFSK